jgi:hypothetical protein
MTDITLIPGPSPKNVRDILANERGLAMLETVPLLVIFVILLSFGMGFFGVIHTGVLNSIAARTYSFETFRQRANLTYFREDGSGERASDAMNYTNKGWRFQAVGHESDPRLKFVATTRPISFGRATASSEESEDTHNTLDAAILPRNEKVSVNPVWVMVGYGICLNAQCGE